MTDRQSDIRALLKRSKENLVRIESKYNSSLLKKSIEPDLKIDIKNFCENLRSVLDYLAHDIREKYCSPPKSGELFYFPILQSIGDFKAKMAIWFPGLEQNSKDLWIYIESVQPYKGANNAWLGHFNRLNNENKHAALVEQTKTETKRVIATSKSGARVSWDPEAVRFGSGVRIAGVPVDPTTQRPVPDSSLDVKEVTWVDFRFEGIDVSALSLLKQSLDGVTSIAERIELQIHK